MATKSVALSFWSKVGENSRTSILRRLARFSTNAKQKDGPHFVPPRHSSGGRPSTGYNLNSPKGLAEQEFVSSVNRPAIIRFLNPWVDLATVTEDRLLSDKVEQVTRTFGVTSGLMCALTMAAMAAPPANDEFEERDANGRRSQRKVPLHKYSPERVSLNSLLTSWGVPGKYLHDIYMAVCASAFYSSVCALGLSTILNAWLSCTPAGSVRHFVRYHSLMICAIPGLLALSSGLAGAALFIGLDKSKGAPVSFIGLGGTIIGGALISTSTIRGMCFTYRSLTPLVKQRFYTFPFWEGSAD